ncbi:MAG: ShlB/FhaC/HecB family hemolysin secretion/activation protein [Steroidobacteraceae bacterium]
MTRLGDVAASAIRIQMPNRIAQLAAPVALLLCLLGSAWAQQVPNAGSILRQLEPQTPELPAPKADSSRKSAPAAAPSGPLIHVRVFRIEGNQRIGTDQIQHLLAAYLNRDLSPADLREATDSIAHLYDRAGRLARVLVPAQRVENGDLLIQVIEGRFGEVVFPDDTDLKALHVSPERIVARVQSRLTPGAPLSSSDLTRGVLLAGDLPGVGVTADEISGAEAGLTDVLLTVKNQDLVSGQFAIDNYGEASIGSERATGWLDFNSLFGFGEEFGVLGIVTPELQFGRLSAALPLNDNGLTLGLNAAGLNYEVHAPLWTASQPHGGSDSFGADLEYQLVRATNHNLSIGMTLLRKNFYDDNIAGHVDDYSVYDAILFANGNLYDSLGKGGVSTASISAGRGWVSMAGSPAESADRFGPDTQGQFGILRYRLDRTQKLSGSLTAYVSLSGQLSYQNLDASEEFYLGGPAGVRVYPVSSNGGSTGRLLTTELRWMALKSSQCTCGIKAFYDMGHIRRNANTDFPTAPLPNSYFLQGAGLGAYGTAGGPVQLHADGGPESGGQCLGRDPRQWADRRPAGHSGVGESGMAVLIEYQ